MSNKNDYGGKSIYSSFSYIYYLLGVNICFIVSNLLFIISILMLKLEFQNIIFFILALIPTGPSLTALFSVSGKLIREGDIYPFRDYIKAYKVNFVETMKVWSIQLILLLIITIDIRYMFIDKEISLLFFKPLLMILGLIVAISIYSYAILSRFKLRTRDLIKLSLLYTFKKLPLSILNIFILGGLIYFAFLKYTILMPIVAGIISYILMLTQKSTLKEIEENLEINYNC